MIDKLMAIGTNILLIRDEKKTETDGFVIPDIAKKKPHTGLIISVGSLVRDPKVKEKKKAVFNQSVGFDLEFDDGVVTVLDETQVIAVL